MFISYGKRRINLHLVKEYNPQLEKRNYIIELTYLDDKKEKLLFFEDKKGRDELLEEMDKFLNI